MHEEPKRDAIELSFIDLANAILRHARLFVVLPLTAAVLAVIIARSAPASYTATASFAPSSQAPQGSRMTSFAVQLGLATASPDASFSPAFYQVLVSSREILGTIVDHEYQVHDGERGTIRAGFMDLLEIEPTSRRSRRENALLHASSIITPRVDDMTGIVRLRVETPWPEMSEAIAARLLEQLNAFNLEKRQGKASAERVFAQARLDSARVELRAAEDRLQSFLQHNRSYQSSPPLVFEYQRLHREWLTRQEVFAALTPIYEQARIDEVRNVPVLMVVEPPQGSAIREARGTVRKAILAVIFGSALALLIVLALEFGRRARESNRPEYRDFLVLRRQALRGLLPFGGAKREVSASDSRA